MASKESSWKFAEDFVIERENIAQVRHHSIEVGVEPISAATGAAISAFAAASGARNIIEIGTGIGVSGLWLLTGAPAADLTTIDSEIDHQLLAKAAFLAAGIPASKVRLIAGRAREVLPRMNEASYDIVFIDADPQSVIEYVEHGLRLVRAGGTVLVAHALWHDRVSDPTQRDDSVTSFRSLLDTVASSAAVVASLSPIGDGLLALTKISA